MGVRDFRELRVFQQAFQASTTIFTHTRTWPAEERYRLADQIKRSSRSVCSNIAEAWRKRRYPAAFVVKLSEADSEARETITWLMSAKSAQYLTVEEADRLVKVYDGICAMLFKMMQNPDSWAFL